MTTRFLLIRHGAHDLLDNTLAGRTRDIDLNEQGRREADALVPRLAGLAVEALYVSPRRRTQATAAALAQATHLVPQELAELDEIDFGDWSGLAFTDLDRDPNWRVWCERRGQVRPPGGETLAEVQVRVIRALERLHEAHPDGMVALVSHGDVIKAALARYLLTPLDHFERFDIAPASVSIIAMGEGWAQVKLVNDIGMLAPRRG